MEGQIIRLVRTVWFPIYATITRHVHIVTSTCLSDYKVWKYGVCMYGDDDADGRSTAGASERNN